MSMGSTMPWHGYDLPFGLCPFFHHGVLDDAFREYLGASRPDLSTLVIIQEGWYFGVTADLRLPRESETGQSKSA